MSTTYKDIIIEGMPSSDDQFAIPELPDKYANEYISALPKIPLPNGRFLFYVRAPAPVVNHLIIDPRVNDQIVANSWEELFASNYNHWDWVFDFEVSQSLGTQIVRVRKKLHEITDEEIHGVYVPGIWFGDNAPEFEVPQFIVEKYVRLQRDTNLILPTITSIDDELLRRIRENPAELQSITPRQFEELICNILTRFGWDVQLTSATKDGGFDIFGFSGAVGGVKSHWIIECKKYSTDNKVGVNIVRSLCGVKEQIKSANAMIVTTSTFTRGALSLAKSRWDLSLRDYENVLEWTRELGNQ